jgi:RimJ/RimL family protein N-acetyltransferase
MIYYETKRLALRNYKSGDAGDYYEYMSLESTARHEDFDPFSLEECEKVIAERISDDSFWVAELKENNKVIGDLCFRKGEYETYDIGYDFNEKYGGKGYATEACEVLVTHIFIYENGRRICAACNEDNIKSWRLLERLGFRREARCIEDASFKKDSNGAPVYVNSYYYALLKREWENAGLYKKQGEA